LFQPVSAVHFSHLVLGCFSWLLGGSRITFAMLLVSLEWRFWPSEVGFGQFDGSDPASLHRQLHQWPAGGWRSLWSIVIPSGKRLHNYGK
jgi:hypothetical protein